MSRKSLIGDNYQTAPHGDRALDIAHHLKMAFIEPHVVSRVPVYGLQGFWPAVPMTPAQKAETG